MLIQVKQANKDDEDKDDKDDAYTADAISNCTWRRQVDGATVALHDDDESLIAKFSVALFASQLVS